MWAINVTTSSVDVNSIDFMEHCDHVTCLETGCKLYIIYKSWEVCGIVMILFPICQEEESLDSDEVELLVDQASEPQPSSLLMGDVTESRHETLDNESYISKSIWAKLDQILELDLSRPLIHTEDMVQGIILFFLLHCSDL